MATTILTGEKPWEDLVQWYQRFPFGDAEPRLHKTTPDTAHFISWGPDADGLHRTPNPIYYSTKAMTTGVFSLAPGDYFKPGNHPNPETYWIRSGTLWLGNADTGQIVQLEPGDGLLIPAFQFHFGYNFGDETVEILFMIARTTHTDQMRANPNYDDHYQKFREPIALHRDIDHRYQRHSSWAQPGFRAAEAPPTRMDDLVCWPSKSSRSVCHDPDTDNVQIVDRRDYLHFVTGSDYGHQFLTSYFYSTNEFQTGKIRVPPGRITNPIRLRGQRVYYNIADAPIVVIASDTGDALIAKRDEAIFVPAGVVHQFQNPGHRALQSVFFAATEPGTYLF